MPVEFKLPIPAHEDPKTSSEESENSVATVGGGTIHPIRTSTTIHGKRSPSPSDDSDVPVDDDQKDEFRKIQGSVVRGSDTLPGSEVLDTKEGGKERTGKKVTFCVDSGSDADESDSDPDESGVKAGDVVKKKKGHLEG